MAEEIFTRADRDNLEYALFSTFHVRFPFVVAAMNEDDWGRAVRCLEPVIERMVRRIVKQQLESGTN